MNKGIKNITEYLDRVLDLQKEYSDKTSEDDSKIRFFYRGQSKKTYNNEKKYTIVPSLFHKKRAVENEYRIFQDIMRLDTDAFESQKNFLDIQKEMQHYCLISRLIDITTQALTGLFFAIAEVTEEQIENKEVSPSVFMFAVNENKLKRPDSDGTQIKLALSTIKDDKREELNKLINEYEDSMRKFKNLKLKKIGKKWFAERFKEDKLRETIKEDFKTICNQIAPDLNHKSLIEYIIKNEKDSFYEKDAYQLVKDYYLGIFNSEESVKKLVYSVQKNDGVLKEIICPENIKDIEFVLPNMNNKRIVAQQGAFIAVGLLDSEEIYNKIGEFLKIPDSASDELMIIDIDIDSVLHIKSQLKAIGINKAVIYPDINKIGEYYKEDLYA